MKALYSVWCGLGSVEKGWESKGRRSMMGPMLVWKCCGKSLSGHCWVGGLATIGYETGIHVHVDIFNSRAAPMEPSMFLITRSPFHDGVGWEAQHCRS